MDLSKIMGGASNIKIFGRVDLIGGYNNTVAGPFTTATIIMGNQNMVGVSANFNAI